MDETWADCVLPINVINNIVFILIWFWLILLISLTIYGLVKTIVQMRPSSTASFIGHHLHAQNLYNFEESGAVLAFIQKCPPDLALILRIYEVELGNKLVGDIVAQLFSIFKNNYSLVETSIDEHSP